MDRPAMAPCCAAEDQTIKQHTIRRDNKAWHKEVQADTKKQLCSWNTESRGWKMTSKDNDGAERGGDVVGDGRANGRKWGVSHDSMQGSFLALPRCNPGSPSQAWRAQGWPILEAAEPACLPVRLRRAAALNPSAPKHQPALPILCTSNTGEVALSVLGPASHRSVPRTGISSTGR